MFKKMLVKLALKILNKYMFYTNAEVQSVKDILTNHVFNQLTTSMPHVKMVNLQKDNHINKLIFEIGLSNNKQITLSLENVLSKYLKIDFHSDITDIYLLSDILQKITPFLKNQEQNILAHMTILGKTKIDNNNDIPTILL
jgi:hypothetical protein